MTPFDRVVKVLRAVLFPLRAEIDESDLLQEDLGADSLDQVEITIGLESEFKIEITDVEAELCFTVKDLVALVEKKIK